MPAKFKIDDSAVIMPLEGEAAEKAEVLYGPNIKPFPQTVPLKDEINAKLTLKVGDNITTDHIMPAGAKILPYRSNIPKMSEFCFTVCDEKFPERAKENKATIIIGGSNYGQGSLRRACGISAYVSGC